MRGTWRVGASAVLLLALAACATSPTPALPSAEQVASHEWDHGPPWGPEEIPWVAPPQVFAAGPGYWGPGYWAPSFGLGIGLGVGRGHWWRGHPGWRGGYHGGGGWRGGGHHRGGGRGRR